MKKVKKKTGNNLSLSQYGSIVFIVGIVLTVIGALVPIEGSTSLRILFGTFVLIGLLIGFLNVTNSESVPFLVATLVIVLLLGPFLGSFVQVLGIQTGFLQKFYSNLIALIVPAALVVAIRAIIMTAKDE